jgi:3-deoxy-7-phosphoheptulonate synthase
MVIVLREDATPAERTELLQLLARAGSAQQSVLVRCSLGDVICMERGALPPALWQQVENLPTVERVVELSTSYQLASKVLQPERTLVRVGSVVIGAAEPVIIAGPCSVESEEQIVAAAMAARRSGARLLRGGAFKPRSSPYSFQGLGLEGLDLLARARAASGLPIVTEVMEPGMLPAVARVADVVQIGSRNMQNVPLLRAAARSGRPVLLKRGFASTIEEWLLAAEYLLAEGNRDVILCERGIRSYDQATRNVLDLACVPLLRRLTHLPVIVDPSHGTGRRELVLAMGTAAIAAGADGLIVEMHPDPDHALSDGAQTITPDMLRRLARQVRSVADVLRAQPADDELPLEQPLHWGSECW